MPSRSSTRSSAWCLGLCNEPLSVPQPAGPWDAALPVQVQRVLPTKPSEQMPFQVRSLGLHVTALTAFLETVPLGIFLKKKNKNKTQTNKNKDGPDWCDSVGWVASCKVKSCWFNSRSGHTPGLWVWSLVGVRARGN